MQAIIAGTAITFRKRTPGAGLKSALRQLFFYSLAPTHFTSSLRRRNYIEVAHP